jgi:hypothetical protein
LQDRACQLGKTKMPRKQIVYWRKTETDSWRTSGFSWTGLFNIGDQRYDESTLTRSCRSLRGTRGVQEIRARDLYMNPKDSVTIRFLKYI